MCISCEGISRRKMLSGLAAGFVAASYGLTATRTTFAQSPSYYRPIRYSLYRTRYNTRRQIRNALGIVVREEVNRRTKYAFTDLEKRKLQQGVSIAAGRMLDPKYWEQALDRASVEYHNFGFRVPNYQEFRKAVGTQMRGLLRHGFPKLHITAWDSKQYTGQAVYKEAVRVSWNNSRRRYDISGEFRIEMSKTQLRERSAEETAGTVVHEMLHQMGHGHTKGYYDNNFITVFGDIVAYGKYIRREKGLGLRSGKKLYLPG